MIQKSEYFYLLEKVLYFDVFMVIPNDFINNINVII